MHGGNANRIAGASGLPGADVLAVSKYPDDNVLVHFHLVVVNVKAQVFDSGNVLVDVADGPSDSTTKHFGCGHDADTDHKYPRKYLRYLSPSVLIKIFFNLVL